MQIVITGGAGFLGVRLARTLLAQGQLSLAGATPQAISKITLVDRAAPPADLLADRRIAALTGDLNSLLEKNNPISLVVSGSTAIIFHLAAAVSGECEADIDVGLRANLDTTRALLDACCALKRVPRLVFSSSLAVYGGDMPQVIADNTLPMPQNSYGTQKFVCEQLIADYTRDRKSVV